MVKLPAYRRIEAHLRAELPKHQVGDLLPTIADLCEKFDVGGVSTIVNAYRPLVDAGLVTVEYKPSRRWVVARVPEARPENPLDAVRADLERQVESIRALLAQAEGTLAQFNAQTAATAVQPSISNSPMKGTMTIEFPPNLTPEVEARLRSALAVCGKLAAQAVTDAGAPEEVLEPALAKEYKAWIAFENGRYGTMPEGVYAAHVDTLSLHHVQEELDLAARILDTFTAYEGVVQLAVERALNGDGEPI